LGNDGTRDSTPDTTESDPSNSSHTVVHFNFQRADPGNADIFTYSVLGDVDKLKNLFNDGLASPNDVHFDSGVKALHLAVSHRKIRACKYLLSVNADSFLEDKVRWTAADNA
jgi:hypothetical protein